MKHLMLIFAVFLLTLSSCQDDDCDVASTIPTCQESPPTNEICSAVFTRWFYNSNTNTCEEIGYSGCSQVGFETESECLSCVCID